MRQESGSSHEITSELAAAVFENSILYTVGYIACIAFVLYGLSRLLKFSNLITNISILPKINTPIVPEIPTPVGATTIVAMLAPAIDVHLSGLLEANKIAIRVFGFFVTGADTKALGIKSGFFSKNRHKSTEPNEVLGGLPSKKTYHEACQYCKQQIIIHGSLYDPRAGENHSFANFFLTALYRHDVTAYRKVVGTTYGIVFLDGAEITLYRRDTRHYKTIFKQGFDLQSCNKPDVRKHHYSEPWTYSYGVSMARIIPSDYYGKNGYFTITFPAGHQFLLIDIVETARLRGRLRERNNVESVLEINSMQSVPRGCVRFFNLESPVKQTIENTFKSPDSPSLTQFGVY